MKRVITVDGGSMPVGRYRVMPEGEPFYILKVEQVSYADGTLTDFDLPKTIGYYTDAATAEAAIVEHLKGWEWRTQNSGRYTNDKRDSREDYRLSSVTVNG